MILADSSAWIEFLRKTGSPAHIRTRELVQRGDPPAVTQMVVMEMVAGARNGAHRDSLLRLLGTSPMIETGGLETYVDAADIYSGCRRAGTTVRGLLDCVIAAVAIREGAALLHHDRDFDAIARHSALELA